MENHIQHIAGVKTMEPYSSQTPVRLINLAYCQASA